MGDIDFMKLACSQADKAFSRGDYPAGCVIVKNKGVVSKASSRGITYRDATAHAELLAISLACKKLKSRFLDGCVVYTSIEPCLMCAKAMVYARIKKVVYGTEHREYGSKKTFDILRANGIGRNVDVFRGVGKEKASLLLQKFLQK
ncbi:MAG TPA: nucleoside deaminase [Candidatus Nanoarchaeia archaeon]|nr:nucleoside deaminase [Candidatus Nanoarchaeia archaeon]